MKQDDTAKILGILATMQEQFTVMQQQIGNLENSFDRIETEMHDGFESVGQQIDAIMSVYDRDDIERVALSAQVERHDKWIKKAAPKIQIKYNEAS